MGGPAETESEFRERLQKGGVVQVLVNFSQRVFSGQKIYSRPDRDFTPDEARLLDRAGLETYFADGTGSKVSDVEFLWGGADAHYGVIVMRSGMAPAERPANVRRWNDDIWYYSEIPIR